MKNPILRHALVAGLALALGASALHAGPIILAGTDSDDHGGFSGGNIGGWKFMEKALLNMAPNVTNGNKKIAILGSSSTALSAANSAFAGTGLSSSGWSTIVVDGTTALNDFFNNTAAAGSRLQDVGLLMMDSADNVSGGATAGELAVFTSFSSTINTFLGNGGGVFSQGNDFGWVSALLPTLADVDLGTGGSSLSLSLTAAGTAAFPGLTNADLSTGPYHNYFSNTGGLAVLATDSLGRAVIIGASAGSVTNPTVPDSGSFIAVYAGLAGLAVAFRRRFVR